MLVADAYPDRSICGLPYYLSDDATDWRDRPPHHHRPRAGADDKVQARLRGLGGTVARLARALVRHGRALTAEIDELEAEIAELVRHLAPSLLTICGCGR